MDPEHLGGVALAPVRQLHRDPDQRALELRHDQIVHVLRGVSLKARRVLPESSEHHLLERARRLGLGFSGRPVAGETIGRVREQGVEHGGMLGVDSPAVNRSSTEPGPRMRRRHGRRRAAQRVHCRFGPMTSPTQRWGYAREALAEALLVARGYRIIERNWRGGGGEIDRIAWEGDLLCFVEVRARSSARYGPWQTVDRAKQRRIIRAASAYLGRIRARPRPMARFDVVSIVDVPGKAAEALLIRNAFDARLG
jgi:putative endonuclease